VIVLGYLQNRVHFAHELHSDVNGAFGDGASELCESVSIFLTRYVSSVL
jgi:hypothetical protein